MLHLIQTKDIAKHSDLKTPMDTLLPKLNYAVITAVLDDTAEKKKTIILSDDVTHIIHLITLTILKNLNSSYVCDITQLSYTY
jgi:hypothetical protein